MTCQSRACAEASNLWVPARIGPYAICAVYRVDCALKHQRRDAKGRDAKITVDDVYCDTSMFLVRVHQRVSTKNQSVGNAICLAGSAKPRHVGRRHCLHAAFWRCAQCAPLHESGRRGAHPMPVATFGRRRQSMLLLQEGCLLIHGCVIERRPGRDMPQNA